LGYYYISLYVFQTYIGITMTEFLFRVGDRCNNDVEYICEVE